MGTTSAPRQASAAPQAALDDTGGMGALQLPASFHLDYVAGKRSAGFLVGMFKKKNAFVRAIVAAEVLGKPKALQEQSIWSPRYSEPSI